MQRSKYVDAPIPSGLPPTERAELHQALEEAFVSGLRASTLIGAALAVASALLAAGLIDGRRPEGTAQVRDLGSAAAGSL